MASAIDIDASTDVDAVVVDAGNGADAAAAADADGDAADGDEDCEGRLRSFPRIFVAFSARRSPNFFPLPPRLPAPFPLPVGGGVGTSDLYPESVDESVAEEFGC